MPPRALVVAALCAATLILVSVFAAPQIARGVENFKTFVSLQSLLNHCDGAGSPSPCHDNRR